MKTLILVPSPMEFTHLKEVPQFKKAGIYHVISRTETWAICGIGPAAAAFSSGHLITRLMPERVILLGIAGAYRESGLKLGDVVQAHSETFADLGYQDARGFHTLDELNLPVLPLGEQTLGARYTLPLLDEDQPSGNFLSVTTLTNDATRATLLARQFSAVAENMEGAAVALACAVHDCPFYQVRAISNFVGPRGSWLIKPALANLREWMSLR